MTHFDFEDVLDEVAEARQVVKLHGVETVNQVEGRLMKTRLLWIGSSWIILDHPGSFILIDSHHIISFQLLTAPMQEPFRPGKCLVKSGTIREHLSAEWLGTGLGPWDP